MTAWSGSAPAPPARQLRPGPSERPATKLPGLSCSSDTAGPHARLHGLRAWDPAQLGDQHSGKARVYPEGGVLWELVPAAHCCCPALCSPPRALPHGARRGAYRGQHGNLGSTNGATRHPATQPRRCVVETKADQRLAARWGLSNRGSRAPPRSVWTWAARRLGHLRRADFTLHLGLLHVCKHTPTKTDGTLNFARAPLCRG